MNSLRKTRVQPAMFRALILALVLMLLLPAVMAQEATQDPEGEPVVTTVAPTEETVIATAEPESTPVPAETTVPEAESPPADETPVDDAETETPADVDATDEPVVEPEVTAEPVTETVPVEVTEEPVPSEESTPAAEVTAEPEADVTDVAPEATEAPVIVTDTAPVIDTFMDDFQTWTGDGWSINGWGVTGDDDGNAYLVSNMPAATAAIAGFGQADLTLEARLQIPANNTAAVTVRASETDAYRFLFDTSGNSRLYRNDMLLTAASAPDGSEPGAWFQIAVQVAGDTLTLSVNGVPVMAYTDASPLPAGQVNFSSGETSNGAVALDDVAVAKADAAILILVTPVATEAPVETTSAAPVVEVTETGSVAEVTVEPEMTPEAVAEVTAEPEMTPEAVAEVTAEPEMTPEAIAEVTAEPEMTPEAVAEVTDETTTTETVVLSADFEDGMTGWTSTGTIMSVDETNSALMLPAGSTLAASEPTTLSAFRVDGSVYLSAEGGLSLFAGSYQLSLSNTGTSLLIDDAPFASNETALALNTWHDFSLTVDGNDVSVSVDDMPVFAFSGSAVASSNVIFMANSDLMLDDIALINLSGDDLTSDVPFTDEMLGRLSNGVFMLAYAMNEGDEDLASIIDGYNVETDETGRILVKLEVSSDYSIADVTALVESLGGTVDADTANDITIEAFVTMEMVRVLASSDEVAYIRQPSRATPTGPVGFGSNPGDFTSFDGLGIQSWHEAGIRGAGINIGVIDTDFGSGAAISGDYSCLAKSGLHFGSTTGTADPHGLNAVEVICDLAPDANVYMLQAETSTELFNAVNFANPGAPSGAQPRMDVIVITLDLGVNTSAGDGDGTGITTDNPYNAIFNATSNGIAVLAAAGNNNDRMVSFEVPASSNGNATIQFSATDGDVVKIGWNEWTGSTGASIGGGSKLINDTEAIQVDSISGGDPTAGLSMTTGVACGVGNVCDYTLTLQVTGGAAATIFQVQLIPVDAGTNESAVQLILQDTNGIPNDGDDYVTGTNVADVTWRTGNLARPADSPDVIAVGAVCADYTQSFPILPHSSTGPVFDTGGALPVVPVPPLTRYDIKPDIVSMSHVGTSRTGFTSDCESGYGGTSAAAAHAAGMVALLKSNTMNASMTDILQSTSFNTGSATGVARLLNYLQTRAVDMPFGADADGYDQTYGAGLSVLGSPYYDLAVSDGTTSLPAPDAPADGECTNGYIYVGQATAGSVNKPDGSIGQPFQSVGQALNNLSTDNQCIVVMPGEYVSPFVIEGVTNTGTVVTAYDDVTTSDDDPSIMWLNAQYYDQTDLGGGVKFGDTYGTAAVFFKNGSTAVTVSGFKFIPTDTYAGSVETRLDPQGAIFYNSADSVLRNSHFGEITLDGVTYPGWNTTFGIPIRVVDSDGIEIADNTFIGNTTGGGSNAGIIGAVNSGTNTDRVRIVGNRFENNSNTSSLNTIDDWAAIVQAEGAIDVVNNIFNNNIAETIVQLRTSSETDPREGRILGNLFLNNTTDTTESSQIFQSSAGPLVHAYYVRNFYVLSNSFIKNVVAPDVDEDQNGGLIMRGSPISSFPFPGSMISDLNQVWEIHNNLFYFNEFTVSTSTGLVNDTANTGAYRCDSLANGFNQGIQFNWLYGNNSNPDTNDDGNLIDDENNDDASNEGGVCDLALAGSFNFSNDPAGQFLGDLPDAGLDDTDPLYYSLSQDENGVFSDGVDRGKRSINAETNSVYTDPTVLDTDVGRKNKRFLDVILADPLPAESEINPTEDDLTLDIGAYEFSPLQIISNPDPREEGPFPEDIGSNINGNNYIQIDLLDGNPDDPNEPNVQGGFGELRYEVNDLENGALEFPDNFGTHCSGGDFNLQNRGTIIDGQYLKYCPPKHFYTDDVNPDIPNNVEITYTVFDDGGSDETGSILITITPEDDADITTGETYDITVLTDNLDTNATIPVQLRPYARFNNFGIVGLDDPDAGVDYLYTYGNPQTSDNVLFTQTDLNTAFASISDDGTVELPLDADKGYQEFTYDVTDANGGGPATYTIRIRARTQLPTGGLYDDSSFVFAYLDQNNEPTGDWQAANSTTSINNTYHYTRTFGDKAVVDFVGTGFVLYMRADRAGATWDLKIRDRLLNTWGAVPGTNDTVFENGVNNFLDDNSNTYSVDCITRSVAGSSLTNLGVTDYTVTCTGFSLEHDNGRHYFEVINTQNGRVLSVDAVSILNDTNTVDSYEPLLPGKYDVDQLSERGLLDTAEWQQVVSNRYSNQLAYQTINTGTLSADANITFSFTGAAGFALETVLENVAATYTICVTNTENSQTTCQDFDNSPLSFTPTTFQAFRPFMGYNPGVVYEVEIKDIEVETSGRMFIDSIIVFPETEQPVKNLPIGGTEDDALEYFVFGEPAETDQWVLNSYNRRASNSTLTSLRRWTEGAGRFITFNVPADADTIYYDYQYSTRNSSQLMVCVDRAIGTADSKHGNCLLVNTNPNSRFDEQSYFVITEDGSYGDPTANGVGEYDDGDTRRDDLQTIQGTLIIGETMFDRAWESSGSYHTVEIFSMERAGIDLDRITVIDSTAPLEAGYYEENSVNIKYYDNTRTEKNPVPYDAISNNFAETFTSLTERQAARDSGQGVVQTSQIGASVFFRFNGTGFAPRFRIDAKSDAVRVCWREDPTETASVADVLDTPDGCQTFNNESRRTNYQVDRPVLGLSDGIYSAAIELLDDDGLPTPHNIRNLPIQMWFDGVSVFSNDLTLLNPITEADNIYEFNVNEPDKEIFIGDSWQYSTLGYARLHSNGDVNLTRLSPGASVIFKTDGSDVLRLLQTTGRAITDLQICYYPVSTPADRQCDVVTNDGKTTYNDTYNIYLPDTSEYVFSISALDTRWFWLDAVELATVGTLQPGFYEQDHPSILARTDSIDLMPDGEMNTENDWTAFDATSVRTTYRRVAPYGRQVVASVDGGIKSQTFDLEADTHYTFTGWVSYTVQYSGNITMELVDGGDNVIAAVDPADEIDASVIGNRTMWQQLRIDFDSGSAQTVAIRFRSTAAGTFYVDSVGAHTGSNWTQTTFRLASDGKYIISDVPGAGLNFSFQGTGFSLGVLTSLSGGNMEVCYDTNSDFSIANCFVYDNENRFTEFIARTVAGLPDDTYYVRVRDMEDGFSGYFRKARTKDSSITLDYVYIYGADDVPANAIGSSVDVNEDYEINGEQALVLLPEDRWKSVFYPRDNGLYSEQTYVEVVTPPINRTSYNYAGAATLLDLDLTNHDEATVVIKSGKSYRLSRYRSDQLLACVDDVNGEIVYNTTTLAYELQDSTNCTLTDQFNTGTEVVLNKANLPLLGGAPGQNRTLFVTTLTRGLTRIDGYRVFYDTTLTEGMYEDTLLSGLATFSADDWQENINRRAYSGGSALYTETTDSTVSFSFEGTGFTILTSSNIYDFGDIEIALTNGPVDITQVESTSIGSNSSQIGLTVGSLPYGTYDVEIKTLADFTFYLDAIYVFGETNALGSLYDDAATDSNGDLLLNYGPENAWVALSGRSVARNIDRTAHTTTRYGATVAFEIGETISSTGIILYDGASTADVEVCFRPVATPQDLDCTTQNTRIDTSGRMIFTPSNGAGNYLVTLRNTSNRLPLQLDAIQVLEETLGEGIYDYSYMEAQGFFNNQANDWSIDTRNKRALGLNNGSSMQFTFNGAGFSIVLLETAVTSDLYNLCVEDTGQPEGTCNIIDENLPRTATGDYALTVAGLAPATGTDATYRVILTNLDALDRDMIVKEVHIMGAPDTEITGTTAFENDNNVFTYLPYGESAEEFDRRNRPSEGSQHSMRVRGGSIYFEYSAQDGFQYVRQIARTLSSVNICYGAFSDGVTDNSLTTANCEAVSNTDGNTFQWSSPVVSGAGNCDSGCWALITQDTSRAMYLDYVSLFDADSPLGAGSYQENYIGFNDFKETGEDTYDFANNDINVSEFPYRTASGGFTRLYRDEAVPEESLESAMKGGMFFRMTGTGFSVQFMQSPRSDAVNICYRRNSTTPQDTINNGTCVTYDNEERRYITIKRSVLGLPAGTYGVAIQMLEDNGKPVVHAGANLPLEMQIDRVDIYDDPVFPASGGGDWVTPTGDALTVMEPGVVYNPTYADGSDYVQYFGDWISDTTRRDGRYIENNFDYTSEAGAGIVLRTSDANALILYTPRSRAYGSIRMCARPVISVDPLAIGDTVCKDYSLTGIGFMQPISFRFGETTGPYIVTIESLENRRFYLDALEVLDVSAPLTEGRYEESHPGLDYGDDLVNVVPDGDMEIGDVWEVIKPTQANVSSSRTRFNGRLSTAVAAQRFVTMDNAGIRSASFDLEANTTYTFTARIFVRRGSVLFTPPDIPGLELTSFNVAGGWQTYRTEFTTDQAYNDLTMSFTASGTPIFYVDAVRITTGAEWETTTSRRASGFNIARSLSDGASVNFKFTGTGFQFGGQLFRTGGEVQVCYDDDETFEEETETGADQHCMVYQQESIRLDNNSARTIVGLPQGTYYVRIKEYDDGLTFISRSAETPRSGRYALASLELDYIQIIDDTVPQSVTPSGQYGESAVDGSDNPYLRVYPENEWTTITGRSANNYSNSSYLTVIETLRGRRNLRSAGQAATLKVSVPEGDTTSVILSTGPVSRKSDQLLVCADHFDGQIVQESLRSDVILESENADCVIKSTMATDGRVVIGSNDLSALGVAGEHTLIFTTLTPGYFDIDGYQVIEGSTLSAGLYDNFLPDDLLDFNTPTTTTVNDERSCDLTQEWCSQKNGRAFDRTQVATAQEGATLDFVFEGTGFSILTEVTPYGRDMRICYVPALSIEAIPDNDAQYDGRESLDPQYEDLNDVWCETVTTDTLFTNWDTINEDRLNPRRGWQYGFSYYGMPFGEYRVEVRVVDPVVFSARRETLKIDAVNIFKDATQLPVMQAGFYDDTSNSISYEPADLWTERVSNSAPPRGPLNGTEHESGYAGSVVQMYVEGNAVTLYQSLSRRNTSDARICLVVTGNAVHCEHDFAIYDRDADPGESIDVRLNNFSQQQGRGVAVPIMFYGLGEGENQLIIENREHNRDLNIDGVMVHP